MSEVFTNIISGCEDVDLSGWNTANVKDMVSLRGIYCDEMCLHIYFHVCRLFCLIGVWRGMNVALTFQGVPSSSSIIRDPCSIKQPSSTAMCQAGILIA